MNNQQQHTITLHGVFLDIFGLGVLLTGASGIGKSEIALGLISRGHRLIADDSIEFFIDESGEVIGCCPEMLKDFLEVRGLGILNIRAMFGDSSVKENVPIQLVANLTRIEDLEIKGTDRLHGLHTTFNILGKAISQVVIPVGPGRNLSVLLETAVRNHRLRTSGYDASEDFVERQKQYMNREELS